MSRPTPTGGATRAGGTTSPRDLEAGAPISRHARALFAIIACSTLIRLLAALAVPLLDDEAHYWVWAQHLMWGYPDHPPMIAGLVALSTRVFGDSVLAVRLPSLVLGGLSTVLIFALTRRLFSPAAGVRAALFFQVLPAFAAGGVMAAPDAPLGVAWLAAMLFGWLATSGVAWAWPASGLVAGLAIQSKLAGSAIALSLAGFILASPQTRRWMRTAWPYLASAVGIAVMVPLVWWNFTHEWATVRRAFVQDAWIHPTGALTNVVALLGSQFLFYAPIGFGILVAALIATVARRRDDERFRFLWWCAAPTLVVAALASLRALAKPHYTGPALLAAMVAAAGLWSEWRARWWLRAGIISSLALTLLGVSIAAIPNPLLKEFHTESSGWPRVAHEVERMLPGVGKPGEVFLLAETYQAGSQLAFALRNRVPVVVPFRGFVLWEPPSAWVSRNGILVDHLGDGAYAALSKTFERVSAPRTVPIRPGYEVRLYPGINFRGLDHVPWIRTSGRAPGTGEVSLQDRH